MGKASEDARNTSVRVEPPYSRGGSDPSPGGCLSTAAALRVDHRRQFFRRGYRGLMCGAGVARSWCREGSGGAWDSQLFLGDIINGIFSKIHLNIITTPLPLLIGAIYHKKKKLKRTTDGWLKLHFACCMICHTPSLGAHVLNLGCYHGFGYSFPQVLWYAVRAYSTIFMNYIGRWVLLGSPEPFISQQKNAAQRTPVKASEIFNRQKYTIISLLRGNLIIRCEEVD